MSTVWRVQAFIDWDTARRCSRPPRRQDLGELTAYTGKVFQILRVDLARILNAIDARAIFIVRYRVYHGWHRGRTATADRRAFERIRNNAVGGRINRVSFESDLEFGNELLCGGLRSQLLDTLRRRENDGSDEQKMVDTALASDLLDYARRYKHNNRYAALVVGDDDDLLPPAITADSWGMRTWVVRRGNMNSMS